MSFAGSLSGAYGQQTYSDPEEIRLRDSQALGRAAHRAALTARERAAICRLSRGYVEFACQLDSGGRIQAITTTRLAEAANSLPPAALARIRESVCRHVRFSVPSVDRPDSRCPYRQIRLALRLSAFCPDNKYK
ncbi:MAG TPA: hypothetical protein VF629_03005 [Hymenobacter sp.]|uniref:hypothetical protein n=1 Tax=Hymenobacter sp. TaxID=1898978 RepID=UPI002ED8FF65